jgi:HEPN domain-containing protein
MPNWISRIKTQSVGSSFSANFLRRAEECRRAAAESLSKGDWSAAAICAVHACISACDAACVYFLGKRHAGEHHNDAVVLFRTINAEDEAFRKNALRLSRVLGIKNMAEYEERLVFRSEAEKALKDCERFVAFVEKALRL